MTDFLNHSYAVQNKETDYILKMFFINRYFQIINNFSKSSTPPILFFFIKKYPF